MIDKHVVVDHYKLKGTNPGTNCLDVAVMAGTDKEAKELPGELLLIEILENLIYEVILGCN